MSHARAPGTRSPSPPPPLLLLSLLPLLLLSPTVRGVCGPLPEVPNATPQSENTTHPVGSHVVYLCNKDFRKIPEKQNTVTCLQDGQWSSLEPFCNQSCDGPQRVPFASLKNEYIELNYFPIGTTVEYECRPGFQRVPLKSGKSTCLANLKWSEVAEICKKKRCPNPGEIAHGHIEIPDIVFGSEIVFSCDTGYKLVGSSSSFCILMGNTVGWSDPNPECIEIFCPDPPNIDNGHIREESDTYVYRKVVTYVCAKGFILVGDSSIYCTVNNGVGEWSGPPPVCKEKSKIPPTSQKPTTVNDPGTRVPATPQKPTSANVPGTRISLKPHKPTKASILSTEAPATPQKPTSANVPGTRIPPVSQKPTSVNVPGTRIPPVSQKPISVNVPGTRIPPVSQKPTSVNVLGTRILPTPQKPTSVNVPGTEVSSNSQKLNTANVPVKEIPSTPQKHSPANVLATEDTPTPQKHSPANVLATEDTPTPQKHSPANVLATEDTPTPQKHSPANVPTTEIPPTPQKTNTSNVLATEDPPTLQKPNTVNVLATEDTLTPQKPNKTNVPATEMPPTPQKTSTSVVLATEIPPAPQQNNTADSPAPEVSPTPQKSITAKHLTTKPATAQISPLSNTVFAKTPPITQNPTKVNSSVQTARTTQRFVTAKSSFTQSLPSTQKPTISHFSMTKGHQIVTQRLTSAHIAVTQYVSTTKTTVRLHSPGTTTENGKSTSGSDRLFYGKFDSRGVKRNCHHSGMHRPYFWKRILSFNCLRKTIKMRCLRAPVGRRVNASYRRVLWTPLGTRYAPSYCQQCSCSKGVLGQLQMIWPVNQGSCSLKFCFPGQNCVYGGQNWQTYSAGKVNIVYSVVSQQDSSFL